MDDIYGNPIFQNFFFFIKAIDKASPNANWEVVLEVGTIPNPDSCTSGINIFMSDDLYKKDFY